MSTTPRNSTARTARHGGKVKTTVVKASDTQHDQDLPVTTGQRPVGTAEDVATTAYNPTGDPAMLQFPSLAGQSHTEVSERSADQDTSSGEYRKVFVVSPPVPGWEPPAGSDPWHLPNRAWVLNEAIQRGLHPSAEAKFAGWEPYGEGVTALALAYEVPVIPAAVDEAAGLTFVPARSESVHGWSSAEPQPE